MAEGGKSAKKGRNSGPCQAYRMNQQREKNKALRLVRHIRGIRIKKSNRHLFQTPGFDEQKYVMRIGDKSAITALKKLPKKFVEDAMEFYGTRFVI